MYKTAAYQVCVVTVAPSGSVPINPLLSDQAYDKVCIAVTPLGSGPNFKYEADLYLDEILIDPFSYTTDGVNYAKHFAYNTQIYPPNLNLTTRPDFVEAPMVSTGFQLIITNSEQDIRDFVVYSTFAMYSGTTCRHFTGSEVRR